MVRPIARFAAALTLLVALVARGAEHEFRLDVSAWDQPPRSVHVAGTFNGWSRTDAPLADPDGDRVWSVRLNLEEGLHHYKFVIDAGTNAERWLHDPGGERALQESDGHGGVNSGVIVGADARRADPPRPESIDGRWVVFDPAEPMDVSRVDATAVRLRVRALAGDAQSARVRLSDGAETRLDLLKQERGLDVFGGVIELAEGQSAFWIELVDGAATHRVGAEAGSAGVAVPATAALETPAWARDAVWYQIFPERFRNGDPSNDPGDFWYERGVAWTSDWWATQPGEAPGEANFYAGAGNVWKRRYGGDLAGVCEKLPYLRRLGVNALYFNPVFEAESMHKYDPADFRHIDDNFGARDPGPRDGLGNRLLFELDGTPMPAGYAESDDPATWRWTRSDLLFLDFLREARRQGFRVILDGVFNHVGRAHPYFQDVLARGQASPFADWFEITDWGDPANWRAMDDPMRVHGRPGGIRWKAWDGPDGHLPVFRKDPQRGLAAGPHAHIMAITRRWLDPDGDPRTTDGIDGWRLDVPGDIPSPFWREWRRVVRAANPQAYISGEIWTWAQPWINAGDQFDAVMNYVFASAAQRFFVDRERRDAPSQLNARVLELLYRYPLQSTLVMQNLFDSHDTDRFASMLVNPDRPYDGQNRLQDNARAIGYNRRAPNPEERARQRLAVTFQMTMVGAPMIYYGNEAGMFSPDDPSNRMPMWWDDLGPFENAEFRFHPEVFEQHQRTIALRRSAPALRSPHFAPLRVDDEAELYVYRRGRGDGAAVVILNRSDQTRRVELPSPHGRPLFDALDPASARVEFDPDAAADARPVLRLAAGAAPVASGEVIAVEVPALSGMVLVGEAALTP